MHYCEVASDFWASFEILAPTGRLSFALNKHYKWSHNAFSSTYTCSCCRPFPAYRGRGAAFLPDSRYTYWLTQESAIPHDNPVSRINMSLHLLF
jgi:hypothetical protein